MPWFRWIKKQIRTPQEAQDALDASDEPDNTGPEPEPGSIALLAGDLTETETPTDESESVGPKRRRRRGNRGGRGRSGGGQGAAASDGDETAADADEPAAEKADKGPRDQNRNRERRRGGSQQAQRRRQPPRRAPLPSAKRELLIAHDVGEQRVAILEDDKVAEVYLERPESRSIVGNIYLGTVDNVLPGMEAAFVEIGLEKNGFLYVDEIVVPELEGKRHGKKIQDLISRGEQLLVQAVKDPMKTKGARLTTEISLPGRFLVFVPNGEGLGVSRRLDDAERARLKDILKAIAPAEGGVIVRTAAEGASAEDIERDLVFLQRLWKTIQTRSAAAKAPDLVYQEAELPLRIVRDLFAGDFVAAYVDDDRTHKRIVGYLKKTSPHMVERVHRWKEKTGLFEHYGVEQEIASTLDRRVDLPSGGYLIFDYAEAFTVIDVNTGRFVGSRSKTSTQRLEDTIVKNNLEAVTEVVRQLRLRDIGGIIVIDFIDMANPKNRQAVEGALRSELERDRTKTYVVEISPLGLVEMTRQNVTDGPREVMTRKCQVCGGDGIVVSDQTQALQVERRLRALAAAGAGSRVQAYRIAVHPRTLALLAGPGGERLAGIEEVSRRRFFLVPAEGHVHADHFEVLAEGKIDDLKPASDLAEGAEIDVKLVELGLHDSAAGVGKAGEIDVIVADAAKLVGRKARVRIGRVLGLSAYGVLVTDNASAEPITFESEAEKPTRAPAKRKVSTATGDDGAAPALADAVELELDLELELDGDATASAEDDDDLETDGDAEVVGTDGVAIPKKRTRRGSRGGRRRKKKPVDGEAAADDDSADAATGDDIDAEIAAVAATGDAPGDGDDAVAAEDKPARPRQRRTPRIHVPEDDAEAGEGAGSDVAPSPRPRTRTAPRAKAGRASVKPDLVSPPTNGAGDADDLAGVREAESAGDVAQLVGDEDVAVADDGAAPGDEPTTPPKKRTRRGSRGGRNRKKKPAGAVAAGTDGDSDSDADTPADSPDTDAVAAAGIDTVTDDGAGADVVLPVHEPETVLAAVAVADPVPVAVAADEPAPEGGIPVTAGSDHGATEDGSGSPDGYVPMSQWIDDFESGRRPNDA